MKFANISFIGREVCNIGDNVQLMAIDHLYACMGIRENDIIRIPYNELSTWKSEDGEKALLPMNFPILEFFEKGLAGIFSADIVPVFLGLTYLKTYLKQDEVEYLKKHEPIGCRDEYTYNTMQKYGIQSYLNGCMTLTLSVKRKNLVNGAGKVYLVGVPQEIERKLPQSILTNAVRRTQTIPREEIGQDINEYVAGRMREYKENAKIVVTSLLHCAVPCISMGIPVILVLPKVSYRFSWIERILPIYTIDEIENIDWNVCVSNEVEEIKEEMLENAIEMIKTRLDDNAIQMQRCDGISAYFLNRVRRSYYVEGFDKMVAYLRANYSNDSEFDYAVWGLTWIAEMVCKYITDNYPNARLAAVFDKNKEILFEGIWSQKIESIEKEKLHNMEIFVTAGAATAAAQKYFEEIRKSDRFCLC